MGESSTNIERCHLQYVEALRADSQISLPKGQVHDSNPFVHFHRAADDLETSQFHTDEEFFSDSNMNRRIPFPLSRDKQKQQHQQEQEQDELDARADARDIITRDEIKRNAFKVQKAKEREKLEVKSP
jgi:hypothetical protein